MSQRQRSALLTVLVLLLTVWGCATVREEAPPPATGAMAPADSLAAAVRALEAGAYSEAVRPLRWAASRCEAGTYGRRALLLLTATTLDPRNPDASLDEGAALAARALALPGIDPDDRKVAEVLYLTALERGAEPPLQATAGGEGTAGQDTAAVVRDTAAVPSDTAAVAPDTAAVDSVDFVPARRFERCGQVMPDGATSVTLPSLPGAPMATLLRRAQARRDSLSQRVTALEAELARIRELLQEAVPVPSDTGSGGGW
ncbi:MAG: hypothetical protein ACN0LA_12265 [Candidatus Longimicrobiales bacterium M2_2A_002]